MKLCKQKIEKVFLRSNSCKSHVRCPLFCLSFVILVTLVSCLQQLKMASNGQSSNGISPGSIVTTVNRSTTGEGVKFRAFDKLARECGKSIHDFNSVLFDVLNAK